MAPRAFWTGHLRLSLVNIPVRLYPATTAERAIAFHQIHEPSGKRIRYQKIAPGVGPVENEEITKGYEYEKGKYVLIDPKEIDELKLESKQTIDLARFVDEDAIDDRYFQTPYYLMPDGDMADEGYVLLHRALKETKKIGVGQFILRGHGNIVAIKPFEKGLLLEVLRHANEIRAADALFDDIPEVKVDKEALDLAKELVKRKAGKFEPKQFKDEYSEAVWELIQAKLEHRKPEIVTEEPGGAKVINIMDALKKSVQQGKSGGAAKSGGKKAAAARGSKKTARTPKRKSA
ncbi:MAG: Ku protein [Methyloceanibacter sp.]|uniref:non-homologous end joining protein Ku n=1 Tax=Methyloceanibacter sp. TaxID=1965321 RepID=UPI003D6D258A